MKETSDRRWLCNSQRITGRMCLWNVGRFRRSCSWRCKLRSLIDSLAVDAIDAVEFADVGNISIIKN